MLCSAKGLLALGFCMVAASLSWIQFILPQWLVADNDIGASSVVRSVGLWGLCIHNSSGTKDSCLAYFSAPNPKEMNLALLPPALANQSICSYYLDNGDALPLGGAYPKEIVNDAFLTRTCESMGPSTLAFSITTAGLGTFMFVAYLVWSCAETTKSCLLLMSKVLAFAALVANLLTITMWLVQQSSLRTGAGIKFGRSFILSVASAMTYCACIVSIGMLRLHEHHEKMREKSLRLQSLRNLKEASSSV
ncbi:hypothetical protein AC1031_000592 [Aphanomyces cochlioides]|nr:hypothetical protein AC1031_000592 [Aphanomyces cochlioides]